MRNYCLTVTYKCNWHCPYCITDTHSRHIDYDDVIKNIDNVPVGARVSLSGGEPGMLKEWQLKEIIGKLRERDCIIQANTNGLILKRPNIVELIDFIFYHCSEDLDIDDEVNKDYKEKTEYMVVVTDDNIDKLQAFLDKHNDIHISIFGAKEVPVKGKSGERLSKKNCIRLIQEFKDYIRPDEIAQILSFNDHQQKTKHLNSGLAISV